MTEKATTLFDSARLIMLVPMVEGFHDWAQRKIFPTTDLSSKDISKKFGFDRRPVITPGTKGYDDIFETFESEYLKRQGCELALTEYAMSSEPWEVSVFIGFTTFRAMEEYCAHMYNKEVNNHPLAIYSRL